MNLMNSFSTLNIEKRLLTEKKQQTTKKIEYIREYILPWALISAERSDIQSISFIDCMCNAGVYRDGDCCTAIEVLLTFDSLCRQYPQKDFCVFFNDIDATKIGILKMVISHVLPNPSRNLHYHIENKDVNDYLDLLKDNTPFGGRSIFGYGRSTILYVDPFDFGTVEIPRVSAILEKHYCELIFNFFLSDYIRNIQRDNGRISKCLGGRTFSTKDELIGFVQSQLRVGKIRYSFAYQFKTKNNVELYQIVFATPNIKGLEVLKDALWKVFNGAQYHRNRLLSGQLSLFSEEDDMLQSLSIYASEARQLLGMKFSGQTVSYEDIKVYLIENTMLKETHIIKNVLSPMISNGLMRKKGRVKANNYKKDLYLILGDG